MFNCCIDFSILNVFAGTEDKQLTKHFKTSFSENKFFLSKKSKLFKLRKLQFYLELINCNTSFSTTDYLILFH